MVQEQKQLSKIQSILRYTKMEYILLSFVLSCQMYWICTDLKIYIRLAPCEDDWVCLKLLCNFCNPHLLDMLRSNFSFHHETP